MDVPEASPPKVQPETPPEKFLPSRREISEFRASRNVFSPFVVQPFRASSSPLLWLNGVKTIDYVEKDAAIPRRGVFAVQIHGGAKTQIW